MTVILMPDVPDVAPDRDIAAVIRNANALTERVGRRALAAVEARPRAAASEFASPLATLASALRGQGRHEEANVVRTRIAALESELLSASPTPTVAEALECLAAHHQRHAEAAQAESLLTVALRIRERDATAGTRALATTLERMIALLRAQGRQNDVTPYVDRLVTLRRAALGHDDPASVLAERTARFGPDHPAVALTAYALAELHRAEGRHDLETALHRRALIIRVRALGPDHLDVADSLKALAECYRRDGRSRQASALSSRAHALLIADARARSLTQQRDGPAPSATPGPA